MTAFEFDRQPSPGSNRHAPDNGCPTCHGDRLVVLTVTEHGSETYGRCPTCNPERPTVREPVAEDAWWKQ